MYNNLTGVKVTLKQTEHLLTTTHKSKKKKKIKKTNIIHVNTLSVSYEL